MKTKPKKPTTDPLDMSNRVDGNGDARAEAEARGNACAAKIGEILREFRCTIRPRIIPKPVGADGSELLVSADFQVWAEPD